MSPPSDPSAESSPAARLSLLAATRPAKRSFSIRGHRTSISLENAFWEALADIARERHVPLAQLVAEVDAARGASGLSGAVRIFILDHYRRQARLETS